MKKQELIHFHGLLVEISEHCRARGVSLDMAGYRDQETRPTSIHRSKTDHKAAVFELSDTITATLREEQLEPSTPSAD
ncbi:MAG: UPF0058 family protein [Halobacteriales archaeon]|nr:UPF0058 family protein [Halobacteriales archaeon]